MQFSYEENQNSRYGKKVLGVPHLSPAHPILDATHFIVGLNHKVLKFRAFFLSNNLIVKAYNHDKNTAITHYAFWMHWCICDAYLTHFYGIFDAFLTDWGCISDTFVTHFNTFLDVFWRIFDAFWRIFDALGMHCFYHVFDAIMMSIRKTCNTQIRLRSLRSRLTGQCSFFKKGFLGWLSILLVLSVLHFCNALLDFHRNRALALKQNIRKKKNFMKR